MRDAIYLEKSGVPTVTLIHDLFEREGRTLARMLGMEQLRFVVLPRPNPEPSVERTLARAKVALPQIVDQLTLADARGPEEKVVSVGG